MVLGDTFCHKRCIQQFNNMDHKLYGRLRSPMDPISIPTPPQDVTLTSHLRCIEQLNSVGSKLYGTREPHRPYFTSYCTADNGVTSTRGAPADELALRNAVLLKGKNPTSKP
jgi:hypothetical protein